MEGIIHAASWVELLSPSWPSHHSSKTVPQLSLSLPPVTLIFSCSSSFSLNIQVSLSTYRCVCCNMQFSFHLCIFSVISTCLGHRCALWAVPNRDLARHQTVQIHVGWLKYPIFSYSFIYTKMVYIFKIINSTLQAFGVRILSQYLIILN